MRLMVAGGAGFVGSHLCRRLVADGHHVVCVDNLLTGSVSNISDLVDLPRFEFLETDVADTPGRPVNVIFHLASPASPFDYDRYPLETLAANSRGTWRLLEVAAAEGAALLYTSTSEVYGDPLVHPQPETYWGNVDPVGPRACYDEAKRFGEALITSFRRKHGVRAAIVRLFNTYGPGMRLDDGRVIPELLSAALAGRPLTIHGDGQQTRSFMYIDDLIEGLIRVGLDPDLDGLVLNIGSTDEITIADLASRISAAFERDLPIAFVKGRPGDPNRRRPDTSRMLERYGWRPTIDLDAGLRLTIRSVVTETGPADLVPLAGSSRLAS